MGSVMFQTKKLESQLQNHAFRDDFAKTGSCTATACAEDSFKGVARDSLVTIALVINLKKVANTEL